MREIIFDFIKRNRWLNRALFFCQERRCKDFWSRIESYIPAKASVLDVGAGTCNMSALLQSRSIKITPLDIADLSLAHGIRPVIYDGSIMPFLDNSFDAAIVLTVLHHCSNPEQVLKESIRVASKVIIIEDVVRGSVHGVLTKCLDSLLNLEFAGHPHQNKTDKEWCRLFDRLGFRLVDKKDVWSFFLMWQVTYVLERK